MSIAKPNQIADKNDFDELQASSGWDPPAPATDNTAAVDMYSPEMIGGSGGDHNSSWLSPTEETYQGFGAA